MSRKRKIQSRKRSVETRHKYREQVDTFHFEFEDGTDQTVKYVVREDCENVPEQYRDVTYVVQLSFPATNYHRSKVSQIVFQYVQKTGSVPFSEWNGKKLIDCPTIVEPDGTERHSLTIRKADCRQFLKFWSVNPGTRAAVLPDCRIEQTKRGIPSNGSHIDYRITKYDKPKRKPMFDGKGKLVEFRE